MASTALPDDLTSQESARPTSPPTNVFFKPENPADVFASGEEPTSANLVAEVLPFPLPISLRAFHERPLQASHQLGHGLAFYHSLDGPHHGLRCLSEVTSHKSRVRL